MKRLNRYVLKILIGAWLSFLISGIVIHQLLAPPNVVLLIDRSYCPEAKWEQVVQAYADLHLQHQEQKLRLHPVIVFSALAQEILPHPPTLEELQQLHTYGRSNSQQQAELKNTYPQAKLLSCPQ